MNTLDKFKLDDKISLVTGTSAGIGAKMALAEAGADVVCHTRRSGEAAEVYGSIENLGRQSLEVNGDLIDKAVPRVLVEQTLEKFGRIDICMNIF